jgi:hypothetical protein
MTAYCIMPAYCDGLYRRDEAINSTTTAQLFGKMPDIVAPFLRCEVPNGKREEECQWFSPASLQFSMLC